MLGVLQPGNPGGSAGVVGPLWPAGRTWLGPDPRAGHPGAPRPRPIRPLADGPATMLRAPWAPAAGRPQPAVATCGSRPGRPGRALRCARVIRLRLLQRKGFL